MSPLSVSANWWKNQQLSVSQESAQDFARKLVEAGAEAVFKASDLDSDGALNQEEFSLAIADQQMSFAKFEVRCVSSRDRDPRPGISFCCIKY